MSALPPPIYIPRPPRVSVYRSPRRITRVLRWSLGIWIVVAVINVVQAVADHRLAVRLHKSWTSVTFDELERSDDRRAVVFGALLVAHALVAAVFIAWTRRLYRNLTGLGIRDLRFSEGWAVGAWFVPFLNLVRPKQIVDDIYRAGSYDIPTWGWQEKVVDPIVHWWWLTYVVGAISFRVSLEAPVDSTGRVFRYTAALVLIALSACLAMVMVKRLSDRQEHQQERLRAEVIATGEKPPYGRWITFVVLGVIGIGAIIAAFNIEPSNDEVRSELVAQLVDGGMSDSEARCYVDGLDAHFDLTSDSPIDVAAIRFIVTTELECVGAPSEMSDCYITSIVDHLGGESAPRDIANALASEKGHRFLFEAGGRCAGFSADQVECFTTQLLDEYPDAFRHLGLNAEQSSYIAAQTQCL